MLMNNCFILSTFIDSIKRLFKIQGYTNPKKENSMTSKRNQYTREFKLEAISLVVDHKRTIPDVADSLGIGKSTLQKWLSQYRQEMTGQAPKVGNALTDEQRELQELRKENKRLRMERDILKKASALLALDSLNGYR